MVNVVTAPVFSRLMHDHRALPADSPSARVDVPRSRRPRASEGGAAVSADVAVGLRSRFADSIRLGSMMLAERMHD